MFSQTPNVSQQERKALSPREFEAFLHSIDMLDEQSRIVMTEVGAIEGLLLTPDYHEKILGSYCGHALKLCLQSLVSTLIMSNCRMWDSNASAIPSILDKIEEAMPEILLRRKADWPDDDNFIVQSKRIIRKAQVAKRFGKCIHNSRLLAEVRVFRSESLAHALPGVSRDRSKLERIHGTVESPTINQVCSLAKASGTLAREILYVGKAVSHDPSEIRGWYSDFMKDLLTALPTLRDWDGASRGD